LFTHDNMTIHPSVVLDQCLMILPSQYLDFVEFSEGHDELSEFNIRMKYVDKHKNELTGGERKLLLACDYTKLNCKELKDLYKEGVLSQDDYLEYRFERMEEETLQRVVDSIRTDEDRKRVLTAVLGPFEPGMTFKVSDDGKTLQPFRPAAGVIIKASLSKPFVTNPLAPSWFIVPVDACNVPDSFSDHSITIPFDGTWFVQGYLCYSNSPSVGRLCVRVSLNGSSLLERTIYCSRQYQSFQAIDVSDTVKLKRGDKITLCNYDSLSNGLPVSILTALLTITFLK